MLDVSSFKKLLRKKNKMVSISDGRRLCKKYNRHIHSSHQLFLLIFFVLNISKCNGRQSTGIDRHPRYAEFDPPRILPSNDFQTVKANSTYTVRCEGSRGVSWRIPETANPDLRSRISISHNSHDQQGNVNNRYSSRRNGFRNNYRKGRNNLSSKSNQENKEEKNYVTVLTIKRLTYSDTGTFTCTYNGTTDLDSIDNSTSVHLYVDDRNHLLRTTSSFDFLHAVQSQTLILPCMPTHPDVNVTLWRDGSRQPERVFMNQYISFDPKVGYRISPITLKQHAGIFVCKGSYRGKEESYTLQVSVSMKTEYVPPPYINRTLARHVRIGDPFSLTCSVTIDFGTMVELNWKTPNSKAVEDNRVTTPQSETKNLTMSGTHLKVVEQGITVHKATKDDQGIYSCTVVDHSHNTQTKSEFIRILEEQESYLRIWLDGYQKVDKTIGDPGNVQWVVQIAAHPEPVVEWYGPNGKIDSDNPHGDYTVRTILGPNARTILTVNRLSLSTAGNFRVKVYNDAHKQEETFSLTVRSPPVVQASVLEHENDALDNEKSNSVQLYKKGHEYTLKCSSKGFPLPKIEWMFKPCTSYTECDNRQQAYRHHFPTHENKRTEHWRDSILKTIATSSGEFICQACNTITCISQNIPFFVTDVNGDGNFAVDGPKQVLEGEPRVKLKCSASVYNFTENSIQWYKHTLSGERLLKSNKGINYEIKSYTTDFSFGSELLFQNISLRDKGRYICKVKSKYEISQNNRRSNNRRSYKYAEFMGSNRNRLNKNDDSYTKQIAFDLFVVPIEPPFFVESNLHGNNTLSKGTDEKIVVDQPDKLLELRCRVGGKPRPQLLWKLNGSPVNASKDANRIQIAEDGQVLRITYVTKKDEGVYECLAKNRGGVRTARRVLQLRSTAEEGEMYANISMPVIIAFACAIVLVIVLIILARLCYCHRNKHKRNAAWKDPPTPPTPRLTQYDRPQNCEGSDDDDCRATLTSTTRDGSISPYTANGNTYAGNNIYGDGSIIGIGSNSPTICSAMLNSPQYQPQQYACPCHSHPVHPCQTLMPKCSICDFSVQTLPMHQMGNHVSMTLKRGQGNIYTNAPYDTMLKSQTISPRLSAEF